MYSILSSGLASAMKSSTPAFSAIYLAVSGLSPVTITVFTPILRRRSNRSRIPVLMMSCNSMTPLISLVLRRRPAAYRRSRRFCVRSCQSSGGKTSCPASVGDATDRFGRRPCGCGVPSGMSTPEHLVSAVNFTIRTPTIVHRVGCRTPCRGCPARRWICPRESGRQPTRART